MQKTSMAAQYTEITLEEMEQFLKRGFRALRPRKGEKRGEVYYDLKVGDHVGIRVWTSIMPRSGMGAGRGQDAIRVQLISLKDQGPLQKGKAPIVKRTQKWRNSLKDRIEEATEKYEDNVDFWEEWAANRSRKGDPEKAQKEQEVQQRQEEREEDKAEHGEQPTYKKPRGSITDKQVKFLNFLISKLSDREWERTSVTLGLPISAKPSKEDIETLSKRQGMDLISYVKDYLEAQGRLKRWASEEDVPE